jgi:hypothetical protein
MRLLNDANPCEVHERNFSIVSAIGQFFKKKTAKRTKKTQKKNYGRHPFSPPPQKLLSQSLPPAATNVVT